MLPSAFTGVKKRHDAKPQTAATATVIASGPARKGKRTKELVKRLHPGDIAIIDHADLDAVAALALADRKPAAVIDAAPPITGKYPNRGPRILLDARIPLLSLKDPVFYDALNEGATVTVRSDGTLEQGRAYAQAAQVWTRDLTDRAISDARRNMTSEIQRFADNTLNFVRTEAETLLEPVTLADISELPAMEKRHVVVVVRGEGYKDDLKSIRGYMLDVRPVVIGVDGGADALLEAGIKPHIILGDMDSVSDRTLACGAKLIVHAYSTGEAPGMQRVQSLGLKAEIFPIPGTSEDAAMLLAYEKGAELIVAVGTHSNLEDFLDKGRAGMASTFLTRLKVGSRLVDARGVSRLHHPRMGVSELAALILSATFVVVALFTQSPVWRSSLRLIHLWWRLTLVNFEHLLWHFKR